MSDELISAFDIRGTEETGLTIECAWNVGKALADFLPTTGGVCVMAGDAQADLKRGVIEGLRLQGRAVVDAGLGGKDMVLSLVKTARLSGAVIIGYDELEKMQTIELYQEDTRLIDSQTGLQAIRELVIAGNFVPAAVKGELTAIA
jgi:phosphomannomutase